MFRPRERAFKQFKCPRPQCVKIVFMFTVTRHFQKHLLDFYQRTGVLYSISLFSKDKKNQNIIGTTQRYFCKFDVITTLSAMRIDCVVGRFYTLCISAVFGGYFVDLRSGHFNTLGHFDAFISF